MRHAHASITAQAVAVMRVVSSSTDTTPVRANDTISGKVLPGLARLIAQGLSALGRRSPAAAHATYAASGHLFEHVALRTAVIDQAITEAVNAGARQLVILGSGLDMRAYRLPCLSDVAVLEVDHPSSQRLKQRNTATLHPLAPSVQHVPVDFTRDDLWTSLRNAGLSSEVPSVFLCEGVFPYLSREAIAGTLSAVARLCAPQSRFLCTYLPQDAHFAPLVQALSTLTLSIIGEPLGQRFSAAEFAMLASDRGFATLWDREPKEWLTHLGAQSQGPIYRYERLCALQFGEA